MAGGVLEVLFIRFSSLGDVLLTTPAVKSLKESLPESRITYLTKGAFAPLLEENPSVDRIVRLEGSSEGVGLSALIRLCRGMGKYDVVVDLHGNVRSRIACASISSGRTLRYVKHALRRRLWVMGWGRSGMGEVRKHVVERYLDALKPLGVNAGPSAPVLNIREDEMEHAAEIVRGKGLQDPSRYGVLVPGARWQNKRWTAEGFSRVGEWLRDVAGMEVVLAGDREDKEWTDEISRRLGGNGIQLTGGTDVRELAAVLKGALIVVGNDSGPGHIATAVGTPLVSLFGPTSEAFGFGPFGERARIVSHDVDCRPCSLHGGSKCPRGSRICLEGIDAQEVVEAVRDVMVEG